MSDKDKSKRQEKMNKPKLSLKEKKLKKAAKKAGQSAFKPEK